MSDKTKPFPLYQCTKQVRALKIRKVVFDAEVAQREGRGTDGTAQLYFYEQGYTAIQVNAEYVRKHEPKPNGYWVLYGSDPESDYQSWSPSDVFEGGYRQIEDPKA